MKEGEDIKLEGEWFDKKGNTLKLYSCIGYQNRFDKEGNLIEGKWENKFGKQIDRRFFIKVNDKEEITFKHDCFKTIVLKSLSNDIIERTVINNIKEYVEKLNKILIEKEINMEVKLNEKP